MTGHRLDTCQPYLLRSLSLSLSLPLPLPHPPLPARSDTVPRVGRAALPYHAPLNALMPSAMATLPSGPDIRASDARPRAERTRPALAIDRAPLGRVRGFAADKPVSASTPIEIIHSMQRSLVVGRPPLSAPRPTRRCALASDTANRLEQARGNDFYSVLGLAPSASKPAIKQAYRAIMRSGGVHPDHQDVRDASDASRAVLVNLVYDILMDDEQRAEYNCLAGFSTMEGANPFASFAVEDTRHRETGGDYVFVDEYSCIGCHACAGVDSETFHIESKWGRARCVKQPAHFGSTPRSLDRVSEAMDVCPVSCIHWVNDRQFSVLEEVCGSMGRVEAYLLMRHQGKGANISVFYEAKLEYSRRQSRVRDAEARAKYRAGGMFMSEYQEWMPSGGAGGAGKRSEQQPMRFSRNITQVIDLISRTWRSGVEIHREPIALLSSVSDDDMGVCE